MSRDGRGFEVFMLCLSPSPIRALIDFFWASWEVR
jgi:hypothetical protein